MADLTKETIEELRGLAEKATSGRWKVFAQEREYVGGTKRSVFEIKTEGKHPQSKDHYPVVAECQHNLPDGPQRGIWMDEADAAFIVAMRNALPALLDVASSTLIAEESTPIEALRRARTALEGRDAQ